MKANCQRNDVKAGHCADGCVMRLLSFSPDFNGEKVDFSYPKCGKQKEPFKYDLSNRPYFPVWAVDMACEKY